MVRTALGLRAIRSGLRTPTHRPTSPLRCTLDRPRFQQGTANVELGTVARPSFDLGRNRRACRGKSQLATNLRWHRLKSPTGRPPPNSHERKRHELLFLQVAPRTQYLRVLRATQRTLDCDDDRYDSHARLWTLRIDGNHRTISFVG